MNRVFVRLVALILIVVLIPVITPFINVEAQTLYSCTLRIVAVSSSGTGVLGSLTVRISSSGSGYIFVSTSPAVEVDVQGAARIAVLAASIVGGFNPLVYDYYFIIEAPSIIVGGPSAGAAMALGVLLALRGVCPRDFVVTGMINPDTTIGPVGGLKEKLETTAKAGIRKFIVPYGQLNYAYYERVAVKRGPFILVNYIPVTVNLADYGKQLNVDVIEALSLSDLYSQITGENLVFREPISMREEHRGLERVASILIEEARESINLAVIRGGLNSLLLEARSSLDSALNLSQSGSYYAALLKAIDAGSLAQASMLAYKAYRGELNISMLYSDINATLEIFNSKYSKLEDNDIGIIEAKGLAYTHAWLSILLYNNSRGPLTLNSLISISRSLWEAKASVAILDNAERLGYSLEYSKLKAISTYIVATARSIAAYTNQIYSEANLGEPPSIAIDMAIAASILDDPIASMFLAINSIALIADSIHRSLNTSSDILSYILLLASTTLNKTNSVIAPSLLNASYKLRDYNLAVQSLLLSWALTIIENSTEEAIIKTYIETPTPTAIEARSNQDKTGGLAYIRLLSSYVSNTILIALLLVSILAIAIIIALIAYKKTRLK
ncbi:MAG: S16 family serine protease [Acidilobaceae archaeon]